MSNQYNLTSNHFPHIYNHFSNMSVSEKTKRNYISDLNHFLKFSKNAINTKIVAKYISHLKNSSTPTKTINRRLTTLRHLSRYLLSQGLLSEDFSKHLKNQSLPKKTNNTKIYYFEKQLKRQQISSNTIKNYLSDIKQFNNWLITNNLQNHSLNHTIINKYTNSLKRSLKPSAIKRKTSSINRYLNWLNLKSPASPSPSFVPTPQKPIFNQKYLYAFAGIIMLLPFFSFSPQKSTTNDLFLKNPSVNVNSIDPKSPLPNNNQIHIILENNEDFTQNYQKHSFDAIKLIESDNYSEPKMDITGNAVLPGNSASTKIYHPNINPNTIINLTPKTNTKNQVLFINSQGNGFFEIAINKPLTKDIQFNWWATNN